MNPACSRKAMTSGDFASRSFSSRRLLSRQTIDVMASYIMASYNVDFSSASLRLKQPGHKDRQVEYVAVAFDVGLG